jgi:hypothetical protein
MVTRRRLKEALKFEEAADEFSLGRGLKRVCVGPNGRGCPEKITDPVILEVAHIGGGGKSEREALKKFYREHELRVPNKRPGGRVYLQMLKVAEDLGYQPNARLDWQCPNCNQREARAGTYEARRAVRSGAHREDIGG